MYERRLRQLSAPTSRGGGTWASGIAAGGGDRRKFVEGLTAHMLEVKALFASTTMVAQVHGCL
jgi:hypothetical protein